PVASRLICGTSDVYEIAGRSRCVRLQVQSGSDWVVLIVKAKVEAVALAELEVDAAEMFLVERLLLQGARVLRDLYVRYGGAVGHREGLSRACDGHGIAGRHREGTVLHQRRNSGVAGESRLQLGESGWIGKGCAAGSNCCSRLKLMHPECAAKEEEPVMQNRPAQRAAPVVLHKSRHKWNGEAEQRRVRVVEAVGILARGAETELRVLLSLQQ